MQFLVRTVSVLPPDHPAAERDRLLSEEQSRSRELSASGKLVAHWRVPLKNETITLWEVSDPAELHEILMSLPAAAWARATATALVQRNLQQHAKDPPNKVA